VRGVAANEPAERERNNRGQPNVKQPPNVLNGDPRVWEVVQETLDEEHLDQLDGDNEEQDGVDNG